MPGVPYGNRTHDSRTVNRHLRRRRPPLRHPVPNPGGKKQSHALMKLLTTCTRGPPTPAGPEGSRIDAANSDRFDYAADT